MVFNKELITVWGGMLGNYNQVKSTVSTRNY